MFQITRVVMEVLVFLEALILIFQEKRTQQLQITLPKTNVAPEDGWLEDEIAYWESPIFKGYVSCTEGFKNKTETRWCSLGLPFISCLVTLYVITVPSWLTVPGVF